MFNKIKWAKFREKRTRVKKSRKEPIQERKPRNRPQITIPWGRGASEYRPGLFTNPTCGTQMFRIGKI